MPGPIPKRSTERRRRNKPEHPITEATFQGDAVIKPPLRPGIHPLAKRWYDSLADSGQSRWYEPSDWAFAMIIAEGIDEFAATRKANMLNNIMTGCTQLLVAEGDVDGSASNSPATPERTGTNKPP